MRIAFVVADWTEVTPGKGSTLAMIREAVAIKLIFCILETCLCAITWLKGLLVVSMLRARFLIRCQRFIRRSRSLR